MSMPILPASQLDVPMANEFLRQTTDAKLAERNVPQNVRATIADCDVRNCHYAGICVRPGSHATIERCRISGAAWRRAANVSAARRPE